MRIGVFICHCGNNIAATVDVERVAAEALTWPWVVYGRDITYTCSQPGQLEIAEAIKKESLTRVVVAACSPRMHEPTFQATLKEAGLNPYLLEMVNIREQCSWIHKDRQEATAKAIQLVQMAVAAVVYRAPLEPFKVSLERKALVIGGGIAGIQAALDMAEAGIEVIMVEREPSIGGNMARLDKTFPTLDCSACILAPRMVEVLQKKNIRLLTYSEVEEVAGFVGNFRVTIRRKAGYVDYERCIGCGQCIAKCPVKTPDRFNLGLNKNRAIYIPFPQAVPLVATISREDCLYLTKEKCGNCQRVCPVGAIDYKMEDRLEEEQVGTIVVATGYDLFDHSDYEEYQGKDIISSLEYERFLSASGPTGGHLKRLSDGRTPEDIVFISCVGSRDDARLPYCSGICCMYLAKQAILTREHLPDSRVFIFYTDIRAVGKGYEEFIRRAQEEYGVGYIRGRVARIYEDQGKLMVEGVDTLLGEQVEIGADLVVLAPGMVPAKGVERLSNLLRLSSDQYGFLTESHPKLRPVETSTAGIYLAGACQGPKDIPLSVAQGSAAAAKGIDLLSKDELETSPLVAVVDQGRCIGCLRCSQVCPYGAIEEINLRDGRVVASVISVLCQGCGLCASTCLPGLITLQGFSDNQIIAKLAALQQSGA